MKATETTEEQNPVLVTNANLLDRWLSLLTSGRRKPAILERLLSGCVTATKEQTEAAILHASENEEKKYLLFLLEQLRQQPFSEEQQLLLEELQRQVSSDEVLLEQQVAKTEAVALSLRWPGEAWPQMVIDWLKEHGVNPVISALLSESIRNRFQNDFEFSQKQQLPPRRGDKSSELNTLFKQLFSIHQQEKKEETLLGLESALTARVFLAWQAIEEDLRRPMIAIDAETQHHELVSGWRDLPNNLGPKSKIKKRKIRSIPGTATEPMRFEILAPNGSSVQLTFPLGDNNWNDAIVRTLREWQGPEGLRHWAALQRLLSIEGGRTGKVRWTLDAHLDALGYRDRHRRDPNVRRRVASQVEVLTKLELAVYAPDGKLRARQQLLRITTKFDAMQGSEWALEGMELGINEWLYRGVRDPETGELGTNWFPAPAELAKIDHNRFPYAIALGLILPMRWRWDLGKSDHCALTGARLLATAGIHYSQHNSGRVWETLRTNLEELQLRGGLERFEWARNPWSLDGICKLHPPQWAKDRVIHQLHPAEQPILPHVLLGRELLEWRKAQRLTQEELAKKLGVTDRTIRLAEAEAENPVGVKLRKALQAINQPNSPTSTHISNKDEQL